MRDKLKSVLVSLVLACGVSTTHAQQAFTIAVITDGPLYQLKDVEETFRQELDELVQDEFALTYRSLVADWSISSVNASLETAYADPTIDMVLVLGAAANQIIVSRPSFPKPTFLPLVFNPDIVGAPGENNLSGRKNLNYLADQIPITQDLATFQRVSPFKVASLVSDTVIIESLPRGQQVLREAAKGVDISFVRHDGVQHNLIDQLPSGTDAVLLGGLPRLPGELFDQFLADMAERGIRSFSLVSEAEVARGALASYTTLTDFRRLARRNALNMQAVMIGQPAEQQPISFQGKRQLTINLDTARRIGLSPRFDVLSEAEVINAEQNIPGPALTLERVARLALANNLSLAVSTQDVELGEQDVQLARANLLPQLSVSGNSIVRRDSELIRGPASAERANAAALSVDQVIYSEAAFSGYQQQQLLQLGRRANLSAARLDQVLSSTTAFLQALRADNQLAIQQENLKLSQTNLDLARDRVRIGSASNADAYRWEANLATARSNVLAARAQRDQAYDQINQILNQPIGQPLKLDAPKRDSPFVIAAEDFDNLVNNPRRFGWFSQFSISRGLEISPALSEIDFQLKALERDITAKRRQFWLPQFSFQGQYLDSISASGRGSGSVFDTANDWNVSLNASLPLFTGRTRRANLDRARVQKRQLELLRQDTALRIEQSIRSALHAAQSSYINIELSRDGATASRKNLDLVSEAYRQGTLSILDLLDAQNQSLQADLNASNAVFNFLLDIMNYQRAISAFDFLLPENEQEAVKESLFNFVEQKEVEHRRRGNSNSESQGTTQ